MNCQAAKPMLVAYAGNELTPADRASLERHLAKCEDCRAALEEARRLLDWTAAASDAQVVQLVDTIVADALAAGASDIHFEGQRDNSLVVRRREDGVLREVCRVEPVMREGVIARLKLEAGMNVAQAHLPQTGRIPKTTERGQYDLRVACAPFALGEEIVIRIIDRTRILIGLDEIGLTRQHALRPVIDGLLGQPNGLILLSGPIGSGRTTTAYSMLQAVRDGRRKVMTAESPVEVHLEGISQMLVKPAAGFTFSKAIATMLHMDPDVILLGEVPDADTANDCIRAALTGHLVIAVMHGNDAVSAIEHFRNLGVAPGLLASSLVGVVNQRLLRKLCRQCRAPLDTVPAPIQSALGIDDATLAGASLQRTRGCQECRQTGYRGRMAIFEAMTVDAETGALIADDDIPGLRRHLAGHGFRTLRDDGIAQALAGETSFDEVMRVLA